MARSPFPQGTKLPDGAVVGRAIVARDGRFWIHATRDGRRALLMTGPFSAEVFTEAPKRAELQPTPFSFGGVDYQLVVAGAKLDLLDRLPMPGTVDEAIAFAGALKEAPAVLQNAIYFGVEGCLLPFTDDAAEAIDKAAVLGRYLSGGVAVSAIDIVALERITPRFDLDDLEHFVSAAGIVPMRASGTERVRRPVRTKASKASALNQQLDRFELPGRKELADFFNEQVIDIIVNEDRYAALGIGFPGGIILEGPTGCGKTFAVERLIEHLGWPSFRIEASTVASPYIHETSRKVAEVFNAAIKTAPAIIVIDEMDAFLAERDSASHQHNVEEVAEFLRRIPEASANRVLVIGMTNKLDLIDPAILRRGRFDHVIHVDHAGLDEVTGLLTALLAPIPHDVADLSKFASQLAGRPLSDVSFVVREAGRLAARARKEHVGDLEMAAALAKCPSRNADDQRRIGF